MNVRPKLKAYAKQNLSTRKSNLVQNRNAITCDANLYTVVYGTNSIVVMASLIPLP